jgi:Putative Ig domain
MAMTSRPASGGLTETEAADDFVLSANMMITHATFVGLLPTGAPLSAITSVDVEIYRVFPKDSTNPPAGNVPTRVNSPSDVAFDARDGLTPTASVLAANFNAANSVVNGINKSPNQTTGGEGAVSGEEVSFDVNFSPPFNLAADHYFFAPQVGLSSGNFLWLSAPRPILAPGTPFPGDLQAWIRNANLSPDWLRVGTDIVGPSSPTFNGTFSLSGSSCPTVAVAPSALPAGVAGSPYAATFTASGGSAPYAFTETGALPSSMSLAATGALSGTPSQPGTFPLTITASDATGCQGTATPTLTIAAAMGAGTGTGTGTGPMPAPALAALKVSPSVFRAASTGATVTRRRKTGTTISYTDSQAATTTFTVLEPRPGVRDKHRGCVRPRRAKRAKRCTRYIAIGSFTHSDAAGRDTLHFTGRLGRRRLKPGSYRLQALPRANGMTGQAAAIPFRIIK